MHGGAPFNQHACDAAFGQIGQHGRNVRPPAGIARDLHHLDAAGRQSSATVRCGVSQGGRFARALGELGPIVQFQPRIQDDAQRRAVLQARQAAGQFGIVGQRCAYADQDCVMARAKQVAIGPGRLARDPLAFACGCGGFPVYALGNLQCDERPSFAHADEKSGVQVGGFLGADAGDNLHARLP